MRGEGCRRVGRLGDRGHVAGPVVGRGDPRRTGDLRDVGQFVDDVGRAGLVQVPRAVAVAVFQELPPVAGAVQAPALGEVLVRDRVLQLRELAPVQVFQPVEQVVQVLLVVVGCRSAVATVFSRYVRLPLRS